MEAQCESDGKELECGDFVILAWLVKNQSKIGHGTMNGLILKAKEYFSGLENIKCNVPYRRWNLNGEPLPEQEPEQVSFTGTIHVLGSGNHILGSGNQAVSNKPFTGE